MPGLVLRGVDLRRLVVGEDAGLRPAVLTQQRDARHLRLRHGARSVIWLTRSSVSPMDVLATRNCDSACSACALRVGRHGMASLLAGPSLCLKDDEAASLGQPGYEGGPPPPGQRRGRQPPASRRRAACRQQLAAREPGGRPRLDSGTDTTRPLRTWSCTTTHPSGTGCPRSARSGLAFDPAGCWSPSIAGSDRPRRDVDPGVQVPSGTAGPRPENSEKVAALGGHVVDVDRRLEVDPALAGLGHGRHGRHDLVDPVGLELHVPRLARHDGIRPTSPARPGPDFLAGVCS